MPTRGECWLANDVSRKSRDYRAAIARLRVGDSLSSSIGGGGGGGGGGGEKDKGDAINLVSPRAVEIEVV